MEPKPIEPQDIRVGDRVQKSWSFCAADYTATFTVDSIDRGKPYSNEGVNPGPDAGVAWTLLNRPEPDRPVGSHWRDPETGAEYVRTDDDERSYVQYRGTRWNATLYQRLDRATIPRLTPVPAFDPAVLWPRAVVATVCRASTVDHESSRYYQCDRVQDHDGPHVEHVDAEARYLWGDPR